MTWYPFVGWPILYVSIILSIILGIVYRKLYPILYMVSVFLYIFTVAFAIDVFELAELFVLTLLISSAILFMLLGYYFSKVLVHLKPHKNDG